MQKAERGTGRTVLGTCAPRDYSKPLRSNYTIKLDEYSKDVLLTIPEHRRLVREAIQAIIEAHSN